MNLKKIGIISGMGTMAGVLFLNKLVNRIDVNRDQDFPEIIFHNNSRIPDRTLAIVYGKESPEIELKRSLDLVAKLGVDYIVSTCVTSYFFLNQIKNNLSGELLNPVELIYEKLQKDYSEIKKIGLLATTGTIKSGLFEEKFVNSDFELIKLDPIDQENKFMESVYMKGGLKSTNVGTKAVVLFEESVSALKQKGAELIVGGCTEVQIGFSLIEVNMPTIDAHDVMVNEVINKLGMNQK